MMIYLTKASEHFCVPPVLNIKTLRMRRRGDCRRATERAVLKLEFASRKLMQHCLMFLSNDLVAIFISSFV